MNTVRPVKLCDVKTTAIVLVFDVVIKQKSVQKSRLQQLCRSQS